MHELTRKPIGGAVRGVLATVPMTAIMFGARRLGLVPELPPKTITDAALDAAEVEAPERDANALAGIAHLAYGAGGGALHAAVAAAAPPSRASTGAVLGMTFGTAVWFASYRGWLPAVGIMPAASRDRPGRPATMSLAHLVFGATHGARRSSRSPPAGEEWCFDDDERGGHIGDRRGLCLGHRLRQDESIADAAQRAAQTWHRERHHRDHRCRCANAVHA